jgi:uncharacterized caspase-like protein
MRRLLLLILIVCAAASGQDRRIQPITARNQVALVFGNAAYPGNALKNPVNDARDVAGRLKGLGYDVDLELDVDRKRMGLALDRFTGKLGPGDVGFLYYSGHGMEIGGENFLIPVDFNFQVSGAAARYDAHSVSRVQELMEKSGAQLNILVLDACRDNPFRHESRGAGSGLAAMNAGRGTFIEFATSPGRSARDNSRERNGLFTKYFLEVLSIPGLDLNGVFDRVRERVDAESAGAQLPWTQSSVVGSYHFVPELAAPTEGSAGVPPAEQQVDVRRLQSELGKLAMKANQLNDRLNSADRSAKGAGGLPAELRRAWDGMNQGLNDATEALKNRDVSSYETAASIARSAMNTIEQELLKP